MSLIPGITIDRSKKLYNHFNSLEDLQSLFKGLRRLMIKEVAYLLIRLRVLSKRVGGLLQTEKLLWRVRNLNSSLRLVIFEITWIVELAELQN